MRPVKTVASRGGLPARLASALVLAPPTLLAAYYGSPALDAVAALVAVLMVTEWEAMSRGRLDIGGWAMALCVGAAALLAADRPLVALALLLLAAPLIAAANRARRLPRSHWLAIGTLYIGIPVASLVWVRAATDAQTMVWLLVVVWAADSGAFAVGRTLRGPKLIPSVSPSKTWSGLLGGLTLGCGAGVMLAWLMDLPPSPLLAAAGLAVAAAAMAGDLLESVFKRRFGVKDSGRMIPGHGGVLDRVDGLMLAGPVVALLVIGARGGVGAWT